MCCTGFQVLVCFLRGSPWNGSINILACMYPCKWGSRYVVHVDVLAFGAGFRVMVGLQRYLSWG